MIKKGNARHKLVKAFDEWYQDRREYLEEYFQEYYKDDKDLLKAFGKSLVEGTAYPRRSKARQ